MKTVSSMTGFGRAKQNILGFDVTVEIKSVNHRYFEYSSRLPKGCAFLDDKLKTLCHKYITRGKIEIFVTVENCGEQKTIFEINKDYSDAYFSALRQLAKEYRLREDFKISSFASNPELFNVKKSDIDEKSLTEAVLSTADIAIKSFLEMRCAEGQRLSEDVAARLEFILSKVAFIEERSPQTVSEYRERLEQKIRELIGDANVDEQRLLTETAVFADKIAVDEETVRLRSHVKSLSDLLEEGGAIGRKIDFLVQEMNREANTIGSKAQDISITKSVVDIKAEIEKIREQIQNIE